MTCLGVPLAQVESLTVPALLNVYVDTPQVDAVTVVTAQAS